MRPWSGRRTCATSWCWRRRRLQAAAARVFVRDLLAYWELVRPETTVVERAVLVADALVTNAVVQARTELLRLELRGDRLHIAVYDDSPRLPQAALAPEAEGGRGLWLVEQLAHAWGCTVTPTAARASGALSSSKSHAPGSRPDLAEQLRSTTPLHYGGVRLIDRPPVDGLFVGLPGTGRELAKPAARSGPEHPGPVRCCRLCRLAGLDRSDPVGAHHLVVLVLDDVAGQTNWLGW